MIKCCNYWNCSSAVLNLLVLAYPQIKAVTLRVPPEPRIKLVPLRVPTHQDCTHLRNPHIKILPLSTQIAPTVNETRIKRHFLIIMSLKTKASIY